MRNTQRIDDTIVVTVQWVTIMKECTKCGKGKELVEFKKDKTKKGGHYSSCRECNKKAWKANYANIAEDHRLKNKRYADANPDKVKRYGKRYYVQNRDAALLRSAKWREDNRGHANSLRTVSKKRYRQAMPVWADRDKINSFYIEAVRKTDITGTQHHVDHIIPIKGVNVCGLHIAENLQVITALENAKKHNHF